MRISRLELHGFKSFADRTVFHFGSGISCVVGPNGCGKSNVVDALKWVIGEMSARSLRGDDMLDVIFAGSAERKPVGYAEVALTLSAEGSEPFPGEYARFSEIQIARRLYRDGTSEYLVNQGRARRKDIVDLIMDSGVGNHLYSFIEQGRIDKIVSASPEDRRSLIDEAAGITRYKLRRQEARTRLEATAAQLDRAADVSDEMGRRLATLEKQVVKAARFRRLRALLRQDEVLLGLVKLRDLRGQLDDSTGRLATLGATVARLEDEATSLEADAVLRAGEVDVASATLSGARDGLAEVDARRRETEAARQLHERGVAEVVAQLDAARRELDAEHARRADAEAVAASSSAGLAEVTAESEVAEPLAVRAREAADAAELALASSREAAQGAELASTRLDADLRELSARHDAVAAQVQEVPERLARLDGRLAAAADEDVVLHKRRAVAEGALADQRAAVALVDERIAARQRAVDEAERRDVHDRDAVGRAEAEVDAAQRAWSEAVTLAEGAAGRLETEVGQVVGLVATQLDARRRVLERDHAGRLASAEASAREAFGDAQGRGRRWLDAAARMEAGELEAWRRGADNAFDEADAGWQGRVQQAHDTAAASVMAAIEVQRTEVERVRAVAIGARDAADEDLARTRAELDEAEAVHAAARARHASLQSRRDALRAAAATSASAPLRGVLGELPRLVDLVGPDHPDAALLGARLLLPVVRSAAQVQRAVEAAGRASVDLVWLPEGVDPSALLHSFDVVDDLGVVPPEGRTRPVVVRGSGVRLDPDGRLVAGDHHAAREAVERRAELDALDAAAADVASAAETSASERDAARSRVADAQAALREAAGRLVEVDRAAHERLRVAEADARREADALPVTLRAQWQAWRTDARGQLGHEAAERAARNARAQGSRQADVDAALDVVRGALDEDVMALRATLQGEREAFEHEAASTIASTREAARQRVQGTTDEVLVRRDALRGEVDRAGRTLAAARERQGQGLRLLEEARAGLEAVQRERNEVDRLIIRLEAEERAAGDGIAALALRTEALREDRARLEARSVELAEARDALDVQLATAREGGTTMASRLADVRSALARDDAAAHHARGARIEADARCAALRERRITLQAALDAASSQLAVTAARIEATTARTGQLLGRRAEGEAALQAAGSLLDALAGERRLAVDAFDAAREAEASLRSARDAAATRLHEVQLQLERARRELLDAERLQRHAGGDLEALTQRIDERYQLSLDALLADLVAHSGLVLEVPDDVKDGLEVGGRAVEPVADLVVRPEMLDDADLVREVVARAEDRRSELGRLGDVNLTALEEYTELKARHDELEAQRQDLDSSVESIRAAIAKMNKTCRERFRETFDRVDDAFRRAYPELVGGGEARLELTDQEDLLETGVEIYVRPPGKRLQALSLLSGGEKAMTAIALLLALFSVKPSPFCVLDEVDAPLDEANGARFNDMIRHMAGLTQFIVITHNRKTMECADTLYGVTMPTPGCSALVSVRIDA